MPSVIPRMALVCHTVRLVADYVAAAAVPSLQQLACSSVLARATGSA